MTNIFTLAEPNIEYNNSPLYSIPQIMTVFIFRPILDDGILITREGDKPNLLVLQIVKLHNMEYM